MVRERQRILTLSNLNRMQVEVKIHESAIDQIRSGLPARITVQGISDRVYDGVVDEVAVLPTSPGRYGSGVMTYEAIVRIDQQVRYLRPGMTAVVEISVDRIEDALTVPVQSVVQRDRQHWVYVSSEGDYEAIPVEVGRANEQRVRIRSGVEVDQEVVLNPLSVLGELEVDDRTITPDAGVPMFPEHLARDLDLRRQLANNAAMRTAADRRLGEPPATETIQ
jgi:multidrug efflux pump subunit AcrA (membrane-fusion protein)